MKAYKLIPLLTLALSIVSCENKTKETEAPPAAPAKIETFNLEKQELSSSVALPAELSGFKQVDLFAKVSSYVKSLKVDIGSNVKQGQLLIELEAPEIQSQLSAAQSRLHSQEAIYTASNSTYKRLLETSKVEGTISKNDLEVAQSRKDSDFAQLSAAKASYNEVQVMQSYLQIRAPFDGKITSRDVNVGAYVGQGQQTPLLTIQDQRKLRLSVSVPEAYSSYLRVDDELKFNVVSLRGENFKAKISRKSGALDLKLRSEIAEMDVINTDDRLLPGMVAEVVLPLKGKKQTYVVPKSAVITNGEGVFVIKVVDKKTQRINVVTGLEANGNIEIFSDDLAQKDVLVKAASEEIIDGTDIN